MLNEVIAYELSNSCLIMNSLSVTSINQTSFQQLSSSMAKRNADQAEQLSQTLRKQANAAQATADQYKEKAQSLDNQANQAQLKSVNLNSKLSMFNAFEQTANQTSNLINRAAVKPTAYSSQNIDSTTDSSKQGTSFHIDTTA